MNNNHTTVLDQTMHYDGEAIPVTIKHEQSETGNGALNFDDGDNVDDAMDGDYGPPAPASLSQTERLERMRQLRLDQLKLRDEQAQIDSEAKSILDQAMLDAKAARRQGRKERRAAKQAMRSAMIGTDACQDPQQQQDDSALNVESVDGSKNQPSVRLETKKQRRRASLAKQEAQRVKGELRATATGANGIPISQAMNTSMDTQVLHGMQHLSFLPATEMHDTSPDYMEMQQEMDQEVKPGKAKKMKKQKDPHQREDQQAMTVLSRMKRNWAKLVANGASAEKAQQAAVDFEYQRLEKIDSRRQRKSAKIQDPRERQAKIVKNANSRRNIEQALRMILEPGYLSPEEAAAFNERVESKVLETSQKSLRKTKTILSRQTNPEDHGLRAGVLGRIGVLRRNLENLKNTFGTQSDQYLNFKSMVEETIKELEAKLATESTVPQSENVQPGSAPTQAGFAQRQSYPKPQGGKALPLDGGDDDGSSDDDDDNDDNDSDDNNDGGVDLDMDGPGSSGGGNGTISAEQARAEDENHLQALRALLGEISLETQ